MLRGVDSRSQASSTCPCFGLSSILPFRSTEAHPSQRLASNHSIRLTPLDKAQDTGRSRLSTQEFSILSIKQHTPLDASCLLLVMASMRCFSFQTHLCSCQGSSLNSCRVQHFLPDLAEKCRKGWSLVLEPHDNLLCQQTISTRFGASWHTLSANNGDFVPV